MTENRLGAARPCLAGPEDAEPGAGPLSRPRDPGDGPRRRRFSPMRLITTAVVAAVAGAGVTAALLPAPGTSASSALAVVARALAQTSADAYSFDLDTAVPSYHHVVPAVVVSGAFDPRHELGTELLTTRANKHPVRMQIRFIGKYVYTLLSPGLGTGTTPRPWDKSPVPAAGPDILPPDDGGYGFISDRPVSLAGLSLVLRSAGTVRDDGSASGPGWTGARYAFTARLVGRESITGTVYVDRQGQVRRLVTITRQGRLAIDRNVTFTGFGARVPVTVPPLAQVQYTSTPERGFYF
jgi:hypothetical protein